MIAGKEARMRSSDPSWNGPASKRLRPPPSGRGVRLFTLLLLPCASLLAVSCDGTRMGCLACMDASFLGTGSCPYSETKLADDALLEPKLLVLSGGGSHGAWGAGVLVGWPSRPEFTVVTGVSTGALQAPFVFLGTSHDPDLEHVFTTVSNSEIYTWKWTALWSNSLQSRAPLKNLIDVYLTDAVIAEVAAVDDRELWVGTVNLDTADFCPWNLSTLAKLAAQSSGAKADCYNDLFRDVVWAASGAPVLAPPVPLDPQACETNVPAPKGGALHVDGGARLRVFAEKVLEPSMASDATAYVIVNGKLVMHPECVEDWIGTIALRAFDIQMSEGMFGSLYYLKENVTTPWTLQLSRIPDSVCLDFPNSEFDPAKMTDLFDAGAAWVQDPANWELAIPDQRVAPWPAGCSGMLKSCGP
jgi:hypothetical protein